MVLSFSAISIADAMPSDVNDRVSEKESIDRPDNGFGKKYLLWIEEDDPKAKHSLKGQMDNLVSHLEEFSITHTEKYQQNKAYWAEKSSRHVGSEGIQPAENNILPSALDAAAVPYCYTGYVNNCW